MRSTWAARRGRAPAAWRSACPRRLSQGWTCRPTSWPWQSTGRGARALHTPLAAALLADLLPTMRSARGVMLGCPPWITATAAADALLSAFWWMLSCKDPDPGSRVAERACIHWHVALSLPWTTMPYLWTNLPPPCHAGDTGLGSQRAGSASATCMPTWKPRASRPPRTTWSRRASWCTSAPRRPCAR